MTFVFGDFASSRVAAIPRYFRRLWTSFPSADRRDSRRNLVEPLDSLRFDEFFAPQGWLRKNLPSPHVPKDHVGQSVSPIGQVYHELSVTFDAKARWIYWGEKWRSAPLEPARGARDLGDRIRHLRFDLQRFSPLGCESSSRPAERARILTAAQIAHVSPLVVSLYNQDITLWIQARPFLPMRKAPIS